MEAEKEVNKILLEAVDIIPLRCGAEVVAVAEVFRAESVNDATDALTMACPQCGQPAEYPDCESCGHEFDAPSSDPATAIRYSRGISRFDAYPSQRVAASFDEFEAAVLADRSQAKGLAYVAAPFGPDARGATHRCADGALPRAWLPFDLDGVRDAEALSDICLHLQRYRGFGYHTASSTPDAPRVRLILSASHEVSREDGERLCLAIEAELVAALGADVASFDRSVYRGEQPCYTPPVGGGTFRFDGRPVDVAAMLPSAPVVERRTTSAERVREIATSDPVLRNLIDNGMVRQDMGSGRYAVKCPFAAEHTSDTGPSATVYMLPHTGGHRHGNFKCLHDHCKDRTQRDFIEALGLDFSRVRSAQANDGVDLTGMPTPAAPATTNTVRPATDLHSRLVSLSNLSDTQPVRHFVEQIIPAGEVTLIGGHGGLGKSYVALLLAVHLATGKAFGSLQTEQAPVLFFSAEDPASTLRWRLAKLCAAEGIDPAVLVGRLHLLDMTDADPALHRESRVPSGPERGAPLDIVFETALLDNLQALVNDLNPGVVVIDGASDTFDDNEIARARVRAFIRSLRQRLAQPGRAVVLLAHVDKQSARANARGATDQVEAYSGSTAWHNSVRSRLALTGEAGKTLKLEHQKANHGRRAEPIELEFVDGVPRIAGSGPNPAADYIAAQKRQQDELDKATLLDLIRQFEARGERVTTATQGPATTFKLLHGEPGFPPGTTRARCNRLLRSLQDAGRLFRGPVQTPDRKWREAFSTSPTGAGSTPNTPPGSAEKPAPPPQIGAESAPIPEAMPAGAPSEPAENPA